MESRNDYLEQVMVQQAQLENDLRGNRAKMRHVPAQQALAPGAPADATVERRAGGGGAMALEGGDLSGPAVEVREFGFWRWKTVVVPPNAHVVHTRRGEAEPLHCGLGISFSYNPATDAYLVAPAAMQTILINARSICKERQGILVQGYVQWIIEDFRTAYRKLDFTDTVDPMRVVNLQLREQAEAAIKDKVATMGVDEVLADKQPIIRELTARLRHVAEGEGSGEGLGLRIVTVQIKEAVISSSSLWETLQRPFRAERSRIARLAELESESIVSKRESEEAKTRAAQAIETESEIARRRAAAEATVFDREQSEKARRAKVEAETVAATMAFEQERAQKLAELARAELERELALEGLRRQSERAAEEQAIALEAARRKVANEVSPGALQEKLVLSLPSIVEKMPAPKELKTISIGQDGLSGLVGTLEHIVRALRENKGPTER
ncbi:hypothetical protein HY251_07285 [bacterium]|nr:hypothetical protein [bacterium]